MYIQLVCLRVSDICFLSNSYYYIMIFSHKIYKFLGKLE